MRAFYLDDETSLDEQALSDEGVLAERLPLDGEAYAPFLDELRAARGYIERDEVRLTPDTKDLDAILQKFLDEHHHTDDEVRFVLEGSGIFDVRSRDDRFMRIVVEAGDLIVVPAMRHHRFMLTDEKRIRAVRLFKDQSGWVPVYRHAA